MQNNIHYIYLTMKRIFILYFIFLCSLQATATNLFLQKTDGTLQSHDISVIGKWIFSDNILQFFDKNGNILASEQITHIRRITFTDFATATEYVKGDNTIMIYPNPTHDILCINGIESQTLRIFDMQGRLLQTSMGTQVTVSELPAGTYLLQIGIQVVRFIKQ